MWSGIRTCTTPTLRQRSDQRDPNPASALLTIAIRQGSACHVLNGIWDPTRTSSAAGCCAPLRRRAGIFYELETRDAGGSRGDWNRAAHAHTGWLALGRLRPTAKSH